MARDLVGPDLPAAFPVHTPDRDPVTVEAAIVGGHQKEALVHAGGPVWRLASDEGAYLKGSDLAPAPLMYWAAGVHAEFTHGFARNLAVEKVSMRRLAVEIAHGYAISGSFFDGSAKGEAFAPAITLDIDCDAPAGIVEELARRAMDTSPVFDALRNRRESTFALYANGRRHAVAQVRAAASADAADPFLSHAAAPAPARLPHPPAISRLAAAIGANTAAQTVALPASTSGIRFASRAVGKLDLSSGDSQCTVSFPSMPSSRFGFHADASGERGPTGLACAWAGVAFCYLTQLSRYIETRKLGVAGARLVQRAPPQGPVETHLFLNGTADDATMQALLAMGAHTCYLHATLGAALEPALRLGEVEVAD